jgi:hypothetical protein
MNHRRHHFVRQRRKEHGLRDHRLVYYGASRISGRRPVALGQGPSRAPSCSRRHPMEKTSTRRCCRLGSDSRYLTGLPEPSRGGLSQWGSACQYRRTQFCSSPAQHRTHRQDGNDARVERVTSPAALAKLMRRWFLNQTAFERFDAG